MDMSLKYSLIKSSVDHFTDYIYTMAASLHAIANKNLFVRYFINFIFSYRKPSTCKSLSKVKRFSSRYQIIMNLLLSSFKPYLFTDLLDMSTIGRHTFITFQKHYNTKKQRKW